MCELLLYIYVYRVKYVYIVANLYIFGIILREKQDPELSFSNNRIGLR